MKYVLWLETDNDTYDGHIVRLLKSSDMDSAIKEVAYFVCSEYCSLNEIVKSSLLKVSDTFDLMDTLRTAFLKRAEEKELRRKAAEAEAYAKAKENERAEYERLKAIYEPKPKQKPKKEFRR